ncbi:hypothetical protein PHYPSEUDO_006408 [Phytophthora pseudosyringae]|uniref:Uncharacterized protein n=1 Tax=Phytophthora pseudosyringae TaxID=221518 RepID=A0A8T1VIN9_9STRA|nr:hypothetical protein PHYPSEUDO_006408 [Phytophthora pseudosyringae]
MVRRSATTASATVPLPASPLAPLASEVPEASSIVHANGEELAAAATPQSKRSSCGKFTEEQDLVLLYAITRRDQLQSWSASLRLPFSGRACSDRLKSLKTWYKKFSGGSEFRSGSGEPETEKMRLLEEIMSLEADGKGVVMSKKADKEQTEKEKSSTGDKLMEAAEKRLSERGKGAQPKVRETDKKRQRNETLELIEKKLE